MKLYYVTAWTGEWSHRRLMFPKLSAAMAYAEQEKENEDVRDVWLTVYDTSRTGSWGAVEIDYNGPIENYESKS